MEGLTNRELEVVRRARRGLKGLLVARILIFAALLIAVLSLFLGYLGEEVFIYLAIILVVGATVQPLGIRGARYEDLVKILEARTQGR